MNRVFNVIMLSMLFIQCHAMDKMCTTLAGEEIKFVKAEASEQERALRILNQTDGVVQLKAVYECKVEAQYNCISCFARCCAPKTLSCTKEVEDQVKIFNRGQTIELTPVLANIFISRKRLVALFAQLHNSNKWSKLTLPSAHSVVPVMMYQRVQNHEDGCTCVLMQDGEELNLI